MKRWGGLFVFLSVMMLGMMSAVSAGATASTDTWAGGGGFVMDLKLIAGSPDFSGTQSFGLDTVAGGHYTPLVNSASFPYTGMTNTFVVSTGGNPSVTVLGNLNNGVNFLLGGTSSFKLEFSDGNNNFSTYSIATSVLQNATASSPTIYSYVLTNNATGVKVAFTSAASPVPIPGTALLLGSSVLGLLGIGTRRKKA